jgi:hypothetical protein
LIFLGILLGPPAEYILRWQDKNGVVTINLHGMLA